MRVVFIGTVMSSKQLLNKLLSMRVNVVGVVTSERNDLNADFVDLVPLCVEFELPYFVCKDVNDDASLKWIKSIKPDIIFCFGWSQLIKKRLLELAPRGVIGFHPTNLPKNRGRHPIIWALALGLQETASTFFMMDQGADSGDILSQRTVFIDVKDDASSLYKKIIVVAERQLEELVPALQNKQVECLKQDHTQANYWRRRCHVDGVIDWRMSANSIYNLIRALTRPYVGSEFVYQGMVYKVWKGSVVVMPGLDNIEPGKVVDVLNGDIVIKCSDDCIRLEEVSPDLKINFGEYL